MSRFPLPKLEKYDVKSIISERETARGVEFLAHLDDGRKLWYPSSKLKTNWDKVTEFKYSSRGVEELEEIPNVSSKKRSRLHPDSDISSYQE